MREILLGLAYPLILSASGLYAAGSCWRRRRRERRGQLASDVHPAFHARRPRQQQHVEVQMRVVKDAHLIVLAEHRRVAALYEEPSETAPSN